MRGLHFVRSHCVFLTHTHHTYSSIRTSPHLTAHTIHPPTHTYSSIHPTRYVDQYNILFECPNWRHHDEGATLRHDRPIIGWTAVRFLPVCLLCYQMAMAGFFSLRGTTFQFTLLVALLLGTMVAYIRWHYVFTRRTMQNMVRE